MHGQIKSMEIIRQPVTKNLRAGKVILKSSEEAGEHIPYKREEIIIILEGNGIVVIEGKKKKIKTGDTIFIAENKKHNIINNSKKKLVYVYVVSIF
ncbi:MAG: cupin domain-containing protein [Nanoarchaeota archaeon]